MERGHCVSEIWNGTGRQMGVKQNTEKWQYNTTCFRTNVFWYRRWIYLPDSYWKYWLMVMRSYCVVILKCVAQRVPLSAVFCVFGDMVIMRKANSGFFTGVTTESWIRSGLWRPSPRACLSSRPHVYQLIRMPGSRASPRLSLFPRYSSTVNLVRSSPTF